MLPKRLLLLIASVLCLGLGLLLSGGVIVTAVVVFATYTLDAVTEFNPHLDHTFTVPEPDTGYLIYIDVENIGDPAPEHELTLTTADGEPVELTPTTLWTTLFGQNRCAVASFEAGGTSEFRVRSEAPPNSRFGVSRHAKQIAEMVNRWAIPSLVGSGIIFLVGVITLLVYVVTAPDPIALESINREEPM